MRKPGNFHPGHFGNFIQVAPRLWNPWKDDAFLRRVLTRLLPQDVMAEVSQDLKRFGDRIVHELEPLGRECEDEPPRLTQTNPWGQRVNNVVTCSAWKQMKRISAEEGLVAIPYEEGSSLHGPWARLYQFIKLYLYSPSSGLYTCPLAMTDGAAKTILELGLGNRFQSIFSHLTSRSPSEFWTSGQWMTEKRGGSDVGSGTETIAEPQPNGSFHLRGYKWFSSATDADMSLTLARIQGQDGTVQKGSQGLSMFLLKTRREDGSLNNIHVMKLKNKLGTRQLPTGELLLDGSEAELVSEPGRGIPSISNMLTITRIHNAVSSVGSMRRIISLSRDYSKRRWAFGGPISDHPLHLNTLADLELKTRGSLIVLIEVARLLGVVETRKLKGADVGDEDLILRLLTPIVKLYTGKTCVGVVSEGLESFGGQGYIEDTGLPRILRDAQVTPIWEGTTNVLALDVLRALFKSKGAVLQALERNLTERLSRVKETSSGLGSSVEKVSRILMEIVEATFQGQVTEGIGRQLSFSLAEVTIGTLLLEQASQVKVKGDPPHPGDIITAQRWIQGMSSFKEKLQIIQSQTESESKELVYDGYNDNEDFL